MLKSGYRAATSRSASGHCLRSTSKGPMIEIGINRHLTTVSLRSGPMEMIFTGTPVCCSINSI